jgi:hypothetical protein
MKDALQATMTTMPAELLRSLTWDRGKELAAHAQFKIDTGIAVCFADPHSPWQRGTNENTNGLFRQYFPKGTDLSRWSLEDLLAVQDAINSRPRKIPQLEDPRRVPDEQLRCSTQQVLQGPVEPKQYTSIRFTEHLELEDIAASIAPWATPTTTRSWNRSSACSRPRRSPRPSSTTAPTRPLPTPSTSLPAGSTGTTTDACTDPSTGSPRSSTSRPTTLHSAESRNAHRGGREAVTRHSAGY